MQNTAQITKKCISQSSSLPRNFLKFWKLQPTVLSSIGIIFAYAWFFIVFPFWGWVVVWAVRGNPCPAALAWASESAVACAAEHLEGLDPFSLPSMQRRGTTNPSISRPFLEVFSSLSHLLLVGETGAKSPSGKGKCSAQMSCSNKPPWTSFQTGSLILWVLPSSLPPLPMSHLQTSRLRRWKQNGSSKMYLSSLFTPIQTALLLFLPLELVRATVQQKSI